MPAYSFEALDPQGTSRKGVLEADTVRAARAQLRTQGLIPLDVQVLDGGAAAQAQGLQRPLWQAPALNPAALAVWTRQLAGLVNAGLPLERALAALSDEAEATRQRHLVLAMRAEVNAGASFAHALAQHPREFSATYVAVVAAGEQSGHLAAVLERLADDLEARQALRGQLLGAALYPAIVTAVALLIVTFLVTYVVPQVAQVFVGTQRSLPWLTRAMLGFSAAVREHGWAALLLLGAAGWGLRLGLRQPAWRLRWDAACLRLPVLGRLARGYNAARFASTLAMLAAAGVPILRALHSAGETLSNQAMRQDAQAALTLVREGAPLASALGRHPRFPPLLGMFARLGEQTGQLPTMLQRAAQQLAGEVQRRAVALVTVLEPLLIVLMGLVVMLIVLAILLPIIELNQFAR